MSLLAPSMRAPTCSSCARRILSPFIAAPAQPSTQQTRFKSSKKRSTKGPDHIIVRLNRDVPSYGRRGSYVSVSAGSMRNTWFRNSTASYITAAEHRDLTARNAPVGRDILFMADQLQEKRGMSKRRQAQIDAAVRAGGQITGTVEEQAEEEGAKAKDKSMGGDVVRVVPTRALELLGVLVPGRLDFRRQARAEGKGIFGSVSTGDVVEMVRVAMGENEEASRVVVGEEDVRFVDVKGEDGKLGETDRVKSLGQYRVEIRVKGAEGAVSRPVRVLPAEEQQETREAVAN
ncbi:putative ribosomal protein L9 [Elsinoe australis]|uniref:Putative ribosomal protein L9 n=1 Tax=Elsinoe australis TaxID=40998 RepID=A0A4V6DWF2_9PEZI|nr:putative ribosomal protein L9 [Elsinoe australis]